MQSYNDSEKMVESIVTIYRSAGHLSKDFISDMNEALMYTSSEIRAYFYEALALKCPEALRCFIEAKRR